MILALEPCHEVTRGKGFSAFNGSEGGGRSLNVAGLSRVQLVGVHINICRAGSSLVLKEGVLNGCKIKGILYALC